MFSIVLLRLTRVSNVFAVIDERVKLDAAQRDRK